MPYQSSTHSQTFPNVSCNPNLFGFFSPTGCVVPPELSRNQATTSKEPYRQELSPPRAAYSHSASVGRRWWYPSPLRLTASQNICASSQLTPSTGWFGPREWLGLVPMTPPTP